MDAYAVIETGGKQYMVKSGDTLSIERLKVDVGERVDIEPVLAASDGKELTVGSPSVDGAKVTATVVEHRRGDKVVSFKQRRRKGYKRKIGHRQDLTVIRVEDLP